jgi:hypothetical protein
MRTLHWLAIIGLVASAGLVACGSDDSGGGTGGGGTTGGAGGGTGGSATGGTGGGDTGGTGGGDTGGTGGGDTGGTGGGDTGGTGGGGTGGTGGTVDCTKDADCLGCCATQNMDGYMKLQEFMIPCVCGANNDGPCAADCNGATDYCGGDGSKPSDACLTCANTEVQGGACSSVLGQCASDATCNTFLTCGLSCP